MKLLKALTVCLVLPFAFLACDQKEGNESAGGDATEKADTHESITTEYFGYMEEAMSAMGSINSKEKAEAFLTKAKELQPKLQSILERAKALPAPTDEEKAAVQAAHKAVKERMDAKQAELSEAMKSNPPTPEAMAAIGQVMQEVMAGDFGKNMQEVTNGVDAIYDLKN